MFPTVLYKVIVDPCIHLGCLTAYYFEALDQWELRGSLNNPCKSPPYRRSYRPSYSISFDVKF